MERLSSNARPIPSEENRELAVSYFNIIAVGVEVLYEAALANGEAFRELRDVADRLVSRVGKWS